MIVTYSYKNPVAPGMETMKVFEEDIQATKPFRELTKTADGGYKLSVRDWDEFDNPWEFNMVLSRQDVEVLKGMIQMGLL